MFVINVREEWWEAEELNDRTDRVQQSELQYGRWYNTSKV